MSLKSGGKIAINQNVYTIVDSAQLDDAIIRSDSTNQVYHVNLANKIDTGNAVFRLNASSQDDSLSHLGILAQSEERFDKARSRYYAIIPVARMPHETQKERGERKLAILKRAKEENVCVRTIYRWMKRFDRHGFKGLIMSDSFGGKGRTRTCKQAESILQNLIDTEFLTRQRMSSAQLYREFESECHAADITKTDKQGRKRCPISQRTVYRRLRRIGDRQTTETRLGHSVYLHKYGLQGGQFRDQEYPLQTIQIDHTKLDVIVRDELTGETIGRPWLTIALDAYSRCVWAYHLGVCQPNADTVGLVIFMGCTRKDWIVKSYGLSEWPVYGIPFQIHTDNGKDFRARLLERGCLENQICLLRRPVKRPQYGGYIERIFGTLNTKLIHTLPGTTFSNVEERKQVEYDSEKESILTFGELEKILVDFIVREYHNTFHEGIGTTPLQKWEAFFEERKEFAPREPEDLERFHQDFLALVEPDGKRLVEPDGIHYKNLVYYASELNLLPREESGVPKKYLVRFDPTDMRSVYIYDDKADRYYRLLLTERPPEAFTLRELEAINRSLRGQGYRRPDNDLVLDNIQRRREFLKSKIESKKCRKILASARVEHQARSHLRADSEIVQVEQDSDDDTFDLSGRIIRYFRNGETDGSGDST